MATAKAKAEAAAALRQRRKLAEELVTLWGKHAQVFARVDELKTALKAAAAGENFKEDFLGIGVVKVSAPKPGGVDGVRPEVIEEVYLTLPEKERRQIEKRGFIKMTEIKRRPYYGSVTVEVFS